jgi:enoyl-CoA hydratase/carnithine racemase
MSHEHVITQLSDGILTVTLNRPDKLNAYTTEMGIGIKEALERANRDDDVRVVVFTGAGRGFCAGADISDGGSIGSGSGLERKGQPAGGFVQRLLESHKPLIAAINGVAIGVGVTMTLPMDFRICASNAKFGFVFTRRGLVPEAGSAWFLQRIVGLPKALEWVYTGRTISPQEALVAGLVSEVVEPQDVLPCAYALAREIADNTAPVATALTRQLMWRAAADSHPEATTRVDAELNLILSRGADVKEGFTALREKRLPRFPGRPSADLPGLWPWWN